MFFSLIEELILNSETSYTILKKINEEVYWTLGKKTNNDPNNTLTASFPLCRQES